MNVVLFWLGAIIKRVPRFVKKYPAVFVFLLTMVICLLTFDIAHISLTQEQYNILFFIIILLIFAKSFKYFDIIPVLIRYSNTKMSTKGIINRYLLKRAIFNCTPYFIFCGCIITRLVTLNFNYNGYIFLLKMFFLLFLFSLCTLCFWFSYNNNKIFIVVGGPLILTSIILSININHRLVIVMVVLSIINSPYAKGRDMI